MLGKTCVKPKENERLNYEVFNNHRPKPYVDFPLKKRWVGVKGLDGDL
jgi:hypothetical protein